MIDVQIQFWVDFESSKKMRCQLEVIKEKWCQFWVSFESNWKCDVSFESILSQIENEMSVLSQSRVTMTIKKNFTMKVLVSKCRCEISISSSIENFFIKTSIDFITTKMIEKTTSKTKKTKWKICKQNTIFTSRASFTRKKFVNKSTSSKTNDKNFVEWMKIDIDFWVSRFFKSKSSCLSNVDESSSTTTRCFDKNVANDFLIKIWIKRCESCCTTNMSFFENFNESFWMSSCEFEISCWSLCSRKTKKICCSCCRRFARWKNSSSCAFFFFNFAI